jgi:hypothetical protein
MLGSRHHALEAMPDLPEPIAEAERQHDLNAVGPKDDPGPSWAEASWMESTTASFLNPQLLDWAIAHLVFSLDSAGTPPTVVMTRKAVKPMAKSPGRSIRRPRSSKRKTKHKKLSFGRRRRNVIRRSQIRCVEPAKCAYY